MVCPNEHLDSSDLDILFGKEFLQIEKTWLVFGLIVVPILDLALQGSKLNCLYSGAGMSGINHGILGLLGRGVYN